MTAARALALTLTPISGTSLVLFAELQASHAALAAWYRPDGEERIDPRDALEIIIESEREQLEATADLEEGVLTRFNRDVELERVVVAGVVAVVVGVDLADGDQTVAGDRRGPGGVGPGGLVERRVGRHGNRGRGPARHRGGVVHGVAGRHRGGVDRQRGAEGR